MGRGILRVVKIEGVWVMNKIILGDHGRCFATSKLLFHAEDVEARGRRKRQKSLFFLVIEPVPV